MNVRDKYIFYVGTARGVVGTTRCKENDKTRFEIDKTNASSITCMEWGRSEHEIILGTANGVLKTYDAVENKFVDCFETIEGEGAVVGLGCEDQLVIAARKSGHVSLVNKTIETIFNTNSDDKATLDCMIYNKNRPNVIGTGGECNDFKLWDLETKKTIFKAKSLGHDELNLPIPTSIRGICSFSEDSILNVCVTKEGDALLYDERVQRRPVLKFHETKASYSCITMSYRERQCLVGTTRGYIQLLDLRTPSKCLKTFKSFTGGVTSIICDSFNPIVASTSMDRFLRLHDLNTKELLYKEYMKQNLTGLLMKPIIKKEEEEANKNAKEPVVDEEYEDLFDSMEVIEEKSSKQQKRKSLSELNAGKELKKQKKLKNKLNK